MAGKKFAPIQNPYAQQPEQTAAAAPAPTRKATYRFNANIPMEAKDYLQEMAWRNRTSITDYLNRIILKDMEAHPEWKDTIDILNK